MKYVVLHEFIGDQWFLEFDNIKDAIEDSKSESAIGIYKKVCECEIDKATEE